MLKTLFCLRDLTLSAKTNLGPNISISAPILRQKSYDSEMETCQDVELCTNSGEMPKKTYISQSEVLF